LRDSGRTLLLCGARDQPARLLLQSDLTEQIGEENILQNVDEALDRAHKVFIDFGGVGAEIARDMGRISLP
jgi:SulP family sulfate permease